MLPDYFKFAIVNNLDEVLQGDDVTLTFRLWKLDSNGALSYSSEVSRAGDGIDIAAGTGYDDLGAAYDNTSNKYMGLHAVVAGALTSGNGYTSPDGTVDVYLLISTDGGTDWGSDGAGLPQGRLVCSLVFDGTQETVSQDFEV